MSIKTSVHNYNKALSLFQKVRDLWDNLEGASDYQYMEALDKVDELEKHISRIDVREISDYLSQKGQEDRFDEVKHNIKVFKEGAYRIGREILGWSYYEDLVDSLPRFISMLKKKYPLEYAKDRNELVREAASLLTHPDNVGRYKTNIEAILKGTMTLPYFKRLFDALIKDKTGVPKEKSFAPRSYPNPPQMYTGKAKEEWEKTREENKKRWEEARESREEKHPDLPTEAPKEIKKGRKNYIKTPEGEEFEYDFETKSSDGVVSYYKGKEKIYSYLSESLLSLLKRTESTIGYNKLLTLEEYIRMNEEFYNPFDEEDEEAARAKREPRQISDAGGFITPRKETFNLARVEWSKRPGGDYSVIAKTQFAKGEIIEICPMLILSEIAKNVDRLKDVLFEIDKKKGEYALVLGYGSLYGHSDEPNVDYAYNKRQRHMFFIANRPIKAFEELTINYGKDYWEERSNLNLIAHDPNISAVKDETEPQPEGESGEVEESGAYQNVTPLDANVQEKGAKVLFASPKSRANPAVSGVAIKGLGQQ